MTLFLSSSAGSVSIFNKPSADMSTSDLSIMPARPFVKTNFNYDGEARAYVLMFPWLFASPSCHDHMLTLASAHLLLF